MLLKIKIKPTSSTLPLSINMDSQAENSTITVEDTKGRTVYSNSYQSQIPELLISQWLVNISSESFGAFEIRLWWKISGRGFVGENPALPHRGGCVCVCVFVCVCVCVEEWRRGRGRGGTAAVLHQAKWKVGVPQRNKDNYQTPWFCAKQMLERGYERCDDVLMSVFAHSNFWQWCLWSCNSNLN